MQTVLKNVSAADVSVYFVWLPCIRSDSKDEAIKRVSEFSDSRVHNYWDEGRLTGNAWQARLGLSTFAWDVYFLFDRSAVWQKPAPQPVFWMHQLGGVTKAPFLNEKEFETQLKKALAETK